MNTAPRGEIAFTENRTAANRDGEGFAAAITDCRTYAGHAYTGDYCWEGQELWFRVTPPDGREYETQEIPFRPYA